MVQIEFLGPPGAGKSTIFSRLIHSDQYYGGLHEDAIKRIILERGSILQEFMYKLTPSFTMSKIEKEFLSYRFRHSALRRFVRKNPDFIQALSQAMDSVAYEPHKIFTKCKRTAEQYQMGISTLNNNEYFCLDEGFAQRAFAIYLRKPDESFIPKEFFSSVPISDLVVHVDAPADVCVERQLCREKSAVEKEWEPTKKLKTQDLRRHYCHELASILSEKTSVLYIENTGSIESVLCQIKSFIE